MNMFGSFELKNGSSWMRRIWICDLWHNWNVLASANSILMNVTSRRPFTLFLAGRFSRACFVGRKKKKLHSNFTSRQWIEDNTVRRFCLLFVMNNLVFFFLLPLVNYFLSSFKNAAETSPDWIWAKSWISSVLVSKTREKWEASEETLNQHQNEQTTRKMVLSLPDQNE